MAEQEQKSKTKILGGSLFLKIIVLIAIALIVSIFVFGSGADLGALFWNFVKVVFALILLYLVFKGIQGFLKKPLFSPTNDFREKVVKLAELSKPFNVKKLFLRGEDMRVYSEFGKITGLLFIPSIASIAETTEKGELILIDKKDANGNLIKDVESGKVVKTPKMKPLTDQDGDFLFTTKRNLGLFTIFSKTELVRVDRSLVSDIGESIWIKDVNLVPVGEYHYPAKQWQSDIKRILIQHQSEALIQTHMAFLDLISTTTHMALSGDPTYLKIMQAQSETLGQQQQGFLVRGQ